MTLKELYESIDGDYEQAVRVLRMDKLIDKHIRKFTKNGVVEKLVAAGKARDAAEIFECAHELKGICGNLGLKSLADPASELAEEFRPGNARRMSDEEVDRLLAAVSDRYRKVDEGIHRYEEG